MNEKQAYVETWGCQLNYHRSEMIAGNLVEYGYKITDEISEADLIVFNTCAVREKSEEKVRGRVGQVKEVRKDESVLGVGGCMAQHLKGELLDSSSGVDFVFGTSNLGEIPELAERAGAGENSVKVPHPEGFEDLPTLRTSDYFAWVTIAEGCSNGCSYCIVPQVRGPLRSRPLEEVLDEIKALSANGYKEIQLLGQNVNAYGDDFENDLDFAWLLEKAAAVHEGKLSFTTPHPSDMDRQTLEVMNKSENIPRHIHLPLQSGSDHVLDTMNRNYDTADYIELIHVARNLDPDVNITTDLIVGHPGETLSDFEQTLDMIKQVQFGSVYVAKFSPRPNTLSATMENNVPPGEKDRRLQKVLRTQKKYSRQFNDRYLGRTTKVLVEGEARETGMFYGKNEFNKTVTFPASADLTGEFVAVKLTAKKNGSLTGILKESVTDDTDSHAKPRI